MIDVADREQMFSVERAGYRMSQNISRLNEVVKISWKNMVKNLVMSKIVRNFALANETFDVSRATKRCGSSAG